MAIFIGNNSKYPGCNVIDFEYGNKELVINLEFVTMGIGLNRNDVLYGANDCTRITYDAKAVPE